MGIKAVRMRKSVVGRTQKMEMSFPVRSDFRIEKSDLTAVERASRCVIIWHMKIN